MTRARDGATRKSRACEGTPSASAPTHSRRARSSGGTGNLLQGARLDIVVGCQETVPIEDIF